MCWWNFTFIYMQTIQFVLRAWDISRKMQILSLFIDASLIQWSQTTVAFHFLTFYLKSWKDEFTMRSLVLFTHILPTSSMCFYRENPLSLNYLKLFINLLMLLRGDNKWMIFRFFWSRLLTVSHEKLLFKLECIGIGGSLLA